MGKFEVKKVKGNGNSLFSSVLRQIPDMTLIDAIRKNVANVMKHKIKYDPKYKVIIIDHINKWMQQSSKIQEIVKSQQYNDDQKINLYFEYMETNPLDHQSIKIKNLDDNHKLYSGGCHELRILADRFNVRIGHISGENETLYYIEPEIGSYIKTIHIYCDESHHYNIATMIEA